MKSPQPMHEKSFAKIVWRIVACAALIALAGCGAGDYRTAPQPSDALQPYRDPGNETPGTFARLETEKIRYSQESYSVSGAAEDGSTYTVEDNVQWLKDHPGQDFPWGGPIRVFRKQAFMDEWGPLTRNRFTGDPKNLESGEIYTLDHRRLVAYRLAARKTIPVEWADLKLVRDQRWRFTTPNRGRSIAATP